MAEVVQVTASEQQHEEGHVHKVPEACNAPCAGEGNTPRSRCVDILASASPRQTSPPARPLSKSLSEAQRLALMVWPRASLVALEPAPAGPLLELAGQIATTFATARATLQKDTPGAVVDARCPPSCFHHLDTCIRQLVGSYAASGSSDWRSLVTFNPHHYVRHLVDGNEDFELMLICWAPGQASRVHNHASSHCWLTALEGRVEEEVFREAPGSELLPVRPGSPRPTMPGVLTLEEQCPELQSCHRALLTPPATGYINDSLGLHKVGCPALTPAPGAVTLHIYAPPIRRVKLYEPEEGRVITRVPGFFSIRGRRV